MLPKMLLRPWKIADDYCEIMVEENLKDDQGRPVKGWSEYDHRLVAIDDEVFSTDSLEGLRTLFHEIIHQILDSMYSEIVKNKAEQERMCEISSMMFIQLMLDNTEKFKAVLKTIERRKRWAERKNQKLRSRGKRRKRR